MAAADNLPSTFAACFHPKNPHPPKKKTNPAEDVKTCLQTGPFMIFDILEML